MTRAPRVKAVEAWAGYVDGHIDVWSSIGYGYEHFDQYMLAIFRTRREARAMYQDVRRVSITPVRKRVKP